ncbi:hypothetical protein [Streptomyces sp. NPDC058755]|uniref:hypothetical protein n=1 Tax=Streptomyces sp. NPDC058755 TaxID=3346624 RepID=UPI0036D1B349
MRRNHSEDLRTAGTVTGLSGNGRFPGAELFDSNGIEATCASWRWGTIRNVEWLTDSGLAAGPRGDRPAVLREHRPHRPAPAAARSAHPGAGEADIQAVAAQAYTLAGRAAFETRDDEAPRALYAEATATAGGTGSSWRRAVVHLGHVLVTLYSTPGTEAAQRLVDAAVRDARARESVTVRARPHGLQAEIVADARR